MTNHKLKWDKFFKFCMDYHDISERRRIPFCFWNDGPTKINYGYFPCDQIFDFARNQFTYDEECKYGDLCIYSHTKNEILFHQLQYKTRRCPSNECDNILEIPVFITGPMRYNMNESQKCALDVCPLAHTPSELRIPHLINRSDHILQYDRLYEPERYDNKDYKYETSFSGAIDSKYDDDGSGANDSKCDDEFRGENDDDGSDTKQETIDSKYDDDDAKRETIETQPGAVNWSEFDEID